MYVRAGERVQVENLLTRLRKKVGIKTRRPWYDLQRNYYVNNDSGVIANVEDLNGALEHFHCRLGYSEAELLFRSFPKNDPTGRRIFNWKAFADKLFPTDNETNLRRIQDGRFEDEEEAYRKAERIAQQERQTARLPPGCYQHQDLPIPPPFSFSTGYESAGTPQPDLATQLLSQKRDLHAPAPNRGNIFAPPPPPHFMNRPRSVEKQVLIHTGVRHIDRHRHCHTMGYPKYQSKLGASVFPGKRVDTNHEMVAQKMGIMTGRATPNTQPYSIF